MGTRRIGANPEKSDLVNFRGPDWRKFSELCVLLSFLGKIDKMLPKSRFSKPIFSHFAGSTKLDRPHRKQFWENLPIFFFFFLPNFRCSFRPSLGEIHQNFALGDFWPKGLRGVWPPFLEIGLFPPFFREKLKGKN